MKTNYKVAIIGASGLVGRTVLKVLEEKNFKNITYYLYSSSKSAGTKIKFLNQNYIIQELKEDSFNLNFDFAIFCAGGDTSKKYIPLASQTGCICIDNSSIYRMDENVPLVVPEVNPEALHLHDNIIANPNCSTIQAVVALKPLDDKYNIQRIVYSTYQAVSGAGVNGIDDLENMSAGDELKKFPHQIYNNCLPHIDVFVDDGYTKEEYKMINETRKILNKPDLKITATTVRVPVINCHCESINIEFEKDFDIYDVKKLLENSQGLILVDNMDKNYYPIPTLANNHDDVFVGRIRRDFSIDNGLNIWVVADNLRKGAASNAVQILEHFIYL